MIARGVRTYWAVVATLVTLCGLGVLFTVEASDAWWFALGVWILGFNLSLQLWVEVWREHRRNRGDHRSARSGARAGLASVTPGGSAAGTSAHPRVVDEPIRAWKLARVVRDGGRWRFAGVGSGGYYDAESVAECVVEGRHDAPHEECGCGFYALTERPAAQRGVVVLEVELYGRVVVHETGYRAEKQRVLAVYSLREPLTRCAHYVYIGWGDNQCGAAGKFVTPGGRPLCAHHVMESGHRFFEAPVEELDLGTEWHWVDA